MQQLAIEWFAEELYKKFEMKGPVKVFDEIFEQAVEMENEQRNTLLKYIEEVRDLCDKLRFPTEEELRELADKADGILKQLKQQEQ